MAHTTRPSLRPSLRWVPGTARSAALTGLLCSALAACGGGGGGSAESDLPVALAEAFGGLAFASPVKLVQHPEDDDRWYVVEQGGKIHTFLASDPVNTLDLSLDLVADQGIDLYAEPNLDEQGLLGLAFDPDFDFDAVNGGELYLAYTNDATGESILARYVSPDAVGPFTPAADPIVLAIPHPLDNHNGGDIAFGPDDLLYYSMGDGGGSNDPDNNGQDRSALLGKVLRIDVLGTPAAGEDYAVPATNPFFGNPFCDAAGVGPTALPCPEVFAYGLRNPWRMSFDMLTGALWLGDVGESRREEIDRIVSGGNYGWDCFEGDQEGPNLGAGCMGLMLEAPEVVHVRDDAAAITGGFVYRGTSIPELEGFYVYGDFSTGNFFAFDADTASAPSERLDLPSISVSAFGQDRDGEVYVLSYFGAPSIYKLVPAP